MSDGPYSIEVKEIDALSLKLDIPPTFWYSFDDSWRKMPGGPSPWIQPNISLRIGYDHLLILAGSKVTTDMQASAHAMSAYFLKAIMFVPDRLAQWEKDRNHRNGIRALDSAQCVKGF